MPNLGKVLRARRGNKISRFFRHIFEHKHAKRVLPMYAAALIATSAYMPASTPSVSAAESAPVSAHMQTVLTETLKGVRYPVNTISITQNYSFFHPGLDLDGTTGDPIYPMMSGKIELIEHSKLGYGLSIIVNHGNGYASRYAHLSKVEVTEGQEVTNNIEIAKMGSTGHSTGDHLHFEVYEYGKTINPMTILPK